EEDPEPAPIEEGNGGGQDEGDAGDNGSGALQSAQERIDAGYSYYGPDSLRTLLESEGYSDGEINSALQDLEVNWPDQAAGMVEQLTDSEYGGYSESGLRESLQYSGFESSQIDDAVNNADIDYNEQAVKALESYQRTFDDSSEEETRNYMEFSGFSTEQID